MSYPVSGEAGDEADAVQAVDAVDALQELREPHRPPVPRVSVRVHRLPEQRDLAAAVRHKHPGFFEDVVGRPAALRAARERHDAVRAELVAAALHAHI